MTPVVAVGSLLLAALAVAQSTVLSFIELAGAQPDVILAGVIFLANRNGSMVGQTAGFVAGIVLDVVGLAPLGFHAALYTVLGALFGITKGKVFVDPVVMPFIMGAVGVVLKGLFASLVAAMFGIEAVQGVLATSSFWIGVVYTGLVAPVFFALLGLIRVIQPDPRRGEVV